MFDEEETQNMRKWALSTINVCLLVKDTLLKRIKQVVEMMATGKI